MHEQLELHLARNLRPGAIVASFSPWNHETGFAVVATVEVETSWGDVPVEIRLKKEICRGPGLSHKVSRLGSAPFAVTGRSPSRFYCRNLYKCMLITFKGTQARFLRYLGHCLKWQDLVMGLSEARIRAPSAMQVAGYALCLMLLA